MIYLQHHLLLIMLMNLIELKALVSHCRLLLQFALQRVKREKQGCGAGGKGRDARCSSSLCCSFAFRLQMFFALHPFYPPELCRQLELPNEPPSGVVHSGGPFSPADLA